MVTFRFVLGVILFARVRFRVGLSLGLELGLGLHYS